MNGMQRKALRGVRAKNVRVTGACDFEIIGLAYLLAGAGCRVTRWAEDEPLPPGHYDMTIVALSAVPLAGWGRYLPWIREVHQQTEGRMVILVPERLGGIRFLRDLGQVYSGYTGLFHLRWLLLTSLMNDNVGRSDKQPVTLTLCQQEAITDLYRVMIKGEKSLKPGKWISYFHRARLLGRMGINHLQILCLAGTDLMEDVILNLSPEQCDKG